MSGPERASADLSQLIETLSNPAAYPDPVESVQVRQTHISVVFLAGKHVYKIKKPVNPGFLDFSTLERRHHFCQEEVRLNRRRAGGVPGAIPVVQTSAGPKFEGTGEAIEWAVKMQRLPEDATLESRLGRNEVGVQLAESFAGRLASFHVAAESNERICSLGRYEFVSQNILDVFAQAEPQVGTTVSRSVFERSRRPCSRNPPVPPATYRRQGSPRRAAQLPWRSSPGSCLCLP